jgi:alkanesulfonate monooxygenase SsuD/methylene tetrahydromethanopterin reductase-like flavin-dependent oxidoreductase (luciferase family)
MTRTGVWFFPDAPASDLVDGIIAAEQAGFDEVWIADEAVSREPLVLLAATARLTTTIKLGIGITSPLLRHPGALASSMATLDELSNGRAILGFGVGGSLSLDPFGITYEKPVALVRDAIRTARAVIEGNTTDLYQPPAHAAPPRQVPIYVGAKGEQLNRLASREADGVFLSGFDHDRVGDAISWARCVRPVHVALYVSVRYRSDAPTSTNALNGDPQSVAAALAEMVNRYRPETIGLALVDLDPIATMMDSATETLRLLQILLTG